MAVFDGIITGGGIIGCMLARTLAERGWRVAVIERGAPGREASWAAAGMLATSAEAENGSPIFTLGQASLRAYGPLADELREETGIDPHYRAEGTLLIFMDEAERQEMLRSFDWQRAQGVAAEELSPAQLQRREPSLAALPGGFFLAADHQIDNRLLMHALVQSCRRRGVEFLLGTPVREVLSNGKAAAGVRLADAAGTEISAARVINTAGAWAGAIAAVGLRAAPIRPVKGHMLALRTESGTLRHVIRSHAAYLVPRVDGRVLVGSTMEEAGFDKTPRAGQIGRLLRAAQGLCPALEQAAVAEMWAGLRPAAPDGLPILGPSGLPGYWLALGHFRNGILLAPVTAQIMSGWLVDGKSPAIPPAFPPTFPIDKLLPQRFD